MEISSRTNTQTNTIDIVITIAQHEFDTADPKSLVRRALTDAAKSLAETYIEENKATILENINPVAVANLAIADSAKLVRKQFIDPDEENKDSDDGK